MALLTQSDKDLLAAVEADNWVEVDQDLFNESHFIDAADGVNKPVNDCKIPVVEVFVELEKFYYADGLMIPKSIKIPDSWTQDTEPDQTTTI